MSLPNQNRRCYLHIGTNKTGSTYIQQAIHGYDDGATYVPRLGRANQSYFLIGAFEVENKRRGEARAARRQFAGAKVFLSSAAHRKKLEAEIKGHRGNVVLSAEALSNHFNSSDAARFVGFLRPHFSRVTAIGYVREPVGLMQSSIQQRVRSGSASLRPDMLRPRYRERLGQWIEVLGRENVTLAMYQRGKMSRWPCTTCSKAAMCFEISPRERELVLARRNPLPMSTRHCLLKHSRSCSPMASIGAPVAFGACSRSEL